jgi:hypothetical protein
MAADALIDTGAILALLDRTGSLASAPVWMLFSSSGFRWSPPQAVLAELYSTWLATAVKETEATWQFHAFRRDLARGPSRIAELPAKFMR